MNKNSLFILLFFSAAVFFLFQECNTSKEDIRTFYRVPLICGVNREIACGSRVKPLFLETEKQPEIKESWINRQGTVIAIVWNESLSQEKKNNIIQPLFAKYEIEAEYVSDTEKKDRIIESFFSNVAPAQKGKDKWYHGMEVDQLSLEEAGSMGDSATLFALKAALINETEAFKIKNDIEEYMKTELIKVRTFKELTSDETDLKWKKQGYEIYIKYIGTERAEDVRDYYIEYQKQIIKKKSCCEKEKNMTPASKITCPYCGHKKMETMPTDICKLVYTCENCKKDIRAKQGVCCVFCSYGDRKCPSMQEDKKSE